MLCSHIKKAYKYVAIIVMVKSYSCPKSGTAFTRVVQPTALPTKGSSWFTEHQTMRAHRISRLNKIATQIKDPEGKWVDTDVFELLILYLKQASVYQYYHNHATVAAVCT